MKLKKHSAEILADGQLKVWVEDVEPEKGVKPREKADKIKVGSFTVTVDASISKADLDKAIKAEYEKIKKQKERIEELGIGEDVLQG